MIGPTPPAESSDVAQARADAVDATNFPVLPTANRDPYLRIMAGTPGILTVMDYANLPQDCRKGIWDAIDEYDVNGTYAPAYPGDSNWAVSPSSQGTPGVDDIGMPPEYDIAQPTTKPPWSLLGDGPLNNPPLLDRETWQQLAVKLTRAQAIDTFGAKVAHALYHESKGTFPWSISRYSVEDLRGLLDPLELFTVSDVPTWDLDRANWAAWIDRVIDIVPQEAYDVAVSFMGNPTNALDALANMQDNALRDLRHHVNEDPNWAIKVKDIFSPADRNDWVSRNGCHTSKDIYAALARSINIPAIQKHGWYWASDGHCTMFFPTVDLGFWHGDDIYSTELTPYRGLAACIRYSDFKALVESEGGYTQEARRQGARLDALIGYEIPHPQYVLNMRNLAHPTGYRGREYLFGIYEWAFYGDTHLLEQVFQHIKRHCEYLTGLPCVHNPASTLETYGRLNIVRGRSDVNYHTTPWWVTSQSGPLPADFSTTWEMDVHTTARATVYTVEWVDSRPNHNPPPDDVVELLEGEEITIGPPAYIPVANAIVVETSVPANATFTLTPNPATGTGFVFGLGETTYLDALPGPYQIQWTDGYVGYDPPIPDTENATLVADTVGITFGPPEYTPE